MQAQMLSHMQQVFADQRVDNEPFQHAFVQGVFPRALYQRMRAMLPADDCYKPFNPDKYRDRLGQPTRLILKLNDKGYSRLPVAQCRFWQQVTGVLESESFKRTVYQCFGNDIALRMGCRTEEVVDLPFFIHSSLVRDKVDYVIKPHPDGRPKVVSMLFYLPGDDSQRDLGTSLYRDRGRLCGLAGQRFEEIKRFPFLPNSCGCFAVNSQGSRTSWHGREVIAPGSGTRDTLQVVWKYADGSLIDDKY